MTLPTSDTIRDPQNIKLDFSPETINSQKKSPLFSLPNEIRQIILLYTLTDDEDLERPYSIHNNWTRPKHYYQRKLNTQVLSTCKRLYSEAWHIPWSNTDQIIHLVDHDRRPERSTNPFKIERSLQALYHNHPQQQRRGSICRATNVDEAMTCPHVQIYAQLYALDQNELQDLWDIEHFLPRKVTVTIRHMDHWFWEQDDRLNIRGSWQGKCRFPASVEEFVFEIESLERKRTQVEWLIEEIGKSWVFERQDGVMLVPKRKVVVEDVSDDEEEEEREEKEVVEELDLDVMKWTGSSVIDSERWIRDENRPDELDFHVVAIKFVPKQPDTEEEVEAAKRKIHDLFIPEGFADVIDSTRPQASVIDLNDCGLEPGTSAEEVRRVLSSDMTPGESHRFHNRHGKHNKRETYEITVNRPPMQYDRTTWPYRKDPRRYRHGGRKFEYFLQFVSEDNVEPRDDGEESHDEEEDDENNNNDGNGNEEANQGEGVEVQRINPDTNVVAQDDGQVENNQEDIQGMIKVEDMVNYFERLYTNLLGYLRIRS